MGFVRSIQIKKLRVAELKFGIDRFLLEYTQKLVFLSFSFFVGFFFGCFAGF